MTKSVTVYPEYMESKRLVYQTNHRSSRDDDDGNGGVVGNMMQFEKPVPSGPCHIESKFSGICRVKGLTKDSIIDTSHLTPIKACPLSFSTFSD